MSRKPTISRRGVNDTTLVDAQQRALFESALQRLRALDEATLTRAVLAPLFGREGRVRILDKRQEIHHGLDLIIHTSRNGIEGVQAKKGRLRTAGDLKQHGVTDQIRSAHAFRFYYGNRTLRLNRFYLIVSSDIEEPAYSRLKDIVDDTWMEIWDVETLAHMISDRMPSLIAELEAADLFRRASTEMSAGLFAAAGRSYSQLGRWYLARHRVGEAHAMFAEASECVAKLPASYRPIFFTRVLRNYYDMCAVQSKTAGSKRSSSRSGGLRHLQPERWRSWVDVRYIESVLALIAERYLSTPHPLTPFEAAQLCLRFGVSPLEQGVATALDEIRRQLREERGRSIDSHCSLCTATVVSCRALAGERNRLPLQWLRRLRRHDYSYRGQSFVGSKRSEHGMYYTAAALLAFMDTGSRDAKTAAALFARKPRTGTHLQRWLAHRKHSASEIGARIFRALLWYLLQKPRISPEERRTIGAAASELTDVVWHAAAHLRDRSAYGEVLENIPALIIATEFTGNDRARELLNGALCTVQRRAQARLAENNASSLLDSRPDRTVRILEGWLLYWEAVFAGWRGIAAASGRRPSA